jgi:hypothetical protein
MSEEEVSEAPDVEDAGLDDDATEGVEEGVDCVAEVESVPSRFAFAAVVLPEEGVGRTEEGLGLEEEGPQV